MKRVLTGIKPTNSLHIGNYCGAIANIKNMSHGEIFIFVADLHALTSNTSISRKSSINIIKVFLSILSDKHEYYIQSDFPQVCEISWYLSCLCSVGQLSRMTQFKSQTNDINSGYLFYPLLMAADILAINAHSIVVGEDQKQHIELTRDLVGSLRKKYNCKFFAKPDPIIMPGSRIKNLQDITKKMSKSEGSNLGTIFLTDSVDEVTKKISKAQTDQLPMPTQIDEIRHVRPQIYNLCEIFSKITNLEFKDIEEKYGDKNISNFKNDLRDAVIQLIEPIQTFCNKTSDIDIENFLLKKQPKINQNINNSIKRLRSSLLQI